MNCLEGIVVLDLSRVVAGPMAAQTLADLGATVWKIETLEGEPVRGWPGAFESVNRGKKGIAINLKHAKGQDLVRQLAARADIVIENYKVGDLLRYGLDYESIKKINSKIIYLSITGFGQNGPRAMQLGYDSVIQGMIGIMTLTGHPDQPPEKVGVAWIDVMTAFAATTGLMGALLERQRSGFGQYIDLSLFDVGMSSLIDVGQRYLIDGQIPMRTGGIHRGVAPAQPFKGSDDWFSITVADDEQFRRMCTALNLESLASDDRFAKNAARMKNRAVLVETLQKLFRGDGRSHWIRVLTEAKVPATPILNVAEAFGDAQTAARNCVWDLPGADGGLKVAANPLQYMTRTPARPSTPPPQIGEHSREVLGKELKLSVDQLDALQNERVIGGMA